MSSAAPTVSVIMPCFNQGAYLEEAVGSVLAQTYQSFEIIIINDGSTDEETVRALERYGRRQEAGFSEGQPVGARSQQPGDGGQAQVVGETPTRITVIHTKNRGPSAARNTGIQQAQGRYILPLDADDRIAPTYLEQAIAILEQQPHVGIVYAQAELFGDRTEPFDLPPYSFPEILLGNMIVNTSLYRKADWEKAGGYNENMTWGWEDYDFWLSLIELGREVVRIPEVLYFHRELPNSRSQQMTRDYWVKSYAQIFANHSQLYSTHIGALFQSLIEMRDDVHQAHGRVHEAQVQMVQAQKVADELQGKVGELQGKVGDLQGKIAAMESSKFWQIRTRWLKLKKGLGVKDVEASITTLPSQYVQKFKKLGQAWQERGTRGFLQFVYDRLRLKFQTHVTYQQWVVRHQFTKAKRMAANQEIERWTLRPVFSVILPVYNVDEQWLQKAIESVRNQVYPDWELCIADDASTRSGIQPLLTRYSKLDPRIKVVFRQTNGNIVATSNSALELATGDYIALLDHDDELAPDALYENAKLINEHPDADFIYSDEDKIDTSGRRSDPFFKPDWSPDYFHSCMYTCHLGVYRTRLIREIGGFRPGYDGSQDYDLVLRVVEKTRNIYHIPKVLYHWRIIPSSVTSGEEAKPWAYEAAVRALTDMVNRSPYPGRVESGPRPGFHRIRREIQGQPLISIVIPSAGTVGDTPDGPRCLLEHCIQSIRDRSSYRNFEIVLVDGHDIPEATLMAIAGPDLRLVRCADPFNFAQRINLGAAAAKGEMLLLLNDDMEVVTPDWLESMLEFAQQKEVGAVGAKLFFADGKIQHVGVMVLGGNPGHAFRNVDGDHPGYFLSNLVNRNYLAITAACLMMRREVYLELGGMDEGFPLNYNDVDLCLKAHQAGYRNVVTPYAQLIHYESASREPGLRPREWQNLNDKWKECFKALDGNDPYYNPNLSRNEVLFEL